MDWNRAQEMHDEDMARYDDVRERYADSEIDGDYEALCDERALEREEATAAEVFGYCPSGDDIVVPQDRGMVFADEFEGEDIPF